MFYIGKVFKLFMHIWQPHLKFISYLTLLSAVKCANRSLNLIKTYKYLYENRLVYSKIDTALRHLN